ncbi:Pantoate-beta-alanine ligase [Suillus variegatus]|nr:Pantoate-beta-alanine ligase [Suillus variegatus]
MSISTLPPSPIPLLTSVASYRQWRQRVFDEGNGSLAENELTVLSIFVNPAQFAPHEDLATYPRTLPGDLELLTAQQVTVGETVRKASAIFLPSVQDMYPSGISQDVSTQKGAFVKMKGYGHQMEGASRPTFFRGVVTVVTKLFNVVRCTNAYFGQKDIQQALLLRRLCKDLLFPHPEADHVHIVPTTQTHISANERKFAPAIYKALQYARSAWSNGESKDRCVSKAVSVIDEVKVQAAMDGMDMRLDYIEMNDSETFDVLDVSSNHQLAGDIPVILSGALWVGKTRLIDSIVVGDLKRIIR